MDDSQIIDLYFARRQEAIVQTQTRYGALLMSIALNLTGSRSDAEECENDTYLRAWNAIPPTRPASLSAWLSKVCRRLALDRWRSQQAQKNGGGQTPVLLDELSECIADPASLPDQDSDLSQELNRFLRGLNKDARIIFLRRYWYGDSIADISRAYGYSQGKVKMSLSRTRTALKKDLGRRLTGPEKGAPHAEG